MTSSATYVIKVWWIHGLSIGRIAHWSGKTTGSIRGIVHRSFDTPRDQMSIQTRQRLLDEMKAERLDGGRLKDEWFVALPLANEQRLSNREAEFPRRPAPEPLSKKEAKAKAAKDAKDAKERELGYAPRGTDAAAFEWLNQRKVLADPPSKVSHEAQSDGSGVRRLTSGLRLRALIDGTRVGNLNSIDYERSGGGSSQPGSASAYRLECIHAVGAIRRGIRSVDALGWELIEAVVDRDEFVFHRVYASERAEIYERLRRALDVVAVSEGMMDRRAFFGRWKVHADVAEAMRRSDAKEVARVARDLLRSAKV